MRMFLGLLTLTGLALLSLAGTGSASSNLPNGSVLTGTGTNVALGSFITCHTTVTATLFNKPAGQGIHASLTAITFSGCTPAGTTVIATGLPRTVDLVGTTNGGQGWDGLVTGGNVDVNVLGLRCNYGGNFGVLYHNATMQLTLGGSLARQTGSDALCPANGPISGIYHINPTLTIS